jgi:hypothetical protein
MDSPTLSIVGLTGATSQTGGLALFVVLLAEELAAAITQADREMYVSKARHRDLLRLDPVPLAAEPS